MRPWAGVRNICRLLVDADNQYIGWHTEMISILFRWKLGSFLVGHPVAELRCLSLELARFIGKVQNTILLARLFHC